MGHVTGMSFYLTHLFKAVVEKISISYHAETMRNGVTKRLTCYGLLVQDNNRKTREGCEIFSKLTMKAPEQRQWHFFLLFLLFTFNN